jgi:hypothetical protein
MGEERERKTLQKDSDRKEGGCIHTHALVEEVGNFEELLHCVSVCGI